MHFHGTVCDLLKIPHYHPTLSEIITYPAEELGCGIRFKTSQVVSLKGETVRTVFTLQLASRNSRFSDYRYFS